MEGYYLVIDDVKSYFSIKSEVYVYFLKKCISKESNDRIINKDEFILLLEKDIDNLLKRNDFGKTNFNLNSNRIKKIEYKHNFITLNLKNDIELLVYNLINIHALVLQSQKMNIQLISNVDMQTKSGH